MLTGVDACYLVCPENNVVLLCGRGGGPDSARTARRSRGGPRPRSAGTDLLPWPTQTGPVAGSAVQSHLPRRPRRWDDLPTSGAAWQRHETSDPKWKIETTVLRHCSHLSLDKDAYKQLNWKQTTFPLRRLLPGASLLAGGRELTGRTSGQRACVVLSAESSLSTHQLRSGDSCPPVPVPEEAETGVSSFGPGNADKVQDRDHGRGSPETQLPFVNVAVGPGPRDPGLPGPNHLHRVPMPPCSVGCAQPRCPPTRAGAPLVNLPASETRQGLRAGAGPYLMSHDHLRLSFPPCLKSWCCRLLRTLSPCPRLVPSAPSLLGTFSTQHPQRRDD